MAYAQEMKNLVAEIKTGHQDRTARIGAIKKETRDILGDADDYMKRVARELKEMAATLKDFLAKSEEARIKDFNAVMKAIQARVRDIQRDTADLLARYNKEMKELTTELKEFLGKSEAARMADFKAMMGDISSDINAIRKTIGTLLADYKAERKEAARYWASLSRRGTVEEKEEEFKCEVCGKEFGSRIALMGHMRSHK